MNLPKLIKIIPLENYHLELFYENGEHKLFDFSEYLSYNIYQKLKNIDNFKKVILSFDTATWYEDIDISPDRLYLEAKKYN